MPQIGGNLPLSLLGQKSNLISLAAGNSYVLPAGMLQVHTGAVSVLQFKDPITGVYRDLGGAVCGPRMIRSDGFNYRIANLSGCAVGALITTAGSGYSSTTPPTVTVSAGSSKWSVIVGGANNSTVTITNGGSGYLYPPILLVDPPPAGGQQCTMTCTISSGAINAVTVTNQGAGYTAVPNIYVINDSRDTAGSGAVLTAGALTGAGTVTGMICTDHGTAVTSVPTFTFSSGSAAATMACAFAATGITVGAGGAAYGNAQPFGVITVGGQVSGTATLTNPEYQANIIGPVRQAVGSGTSTAGGAITATGFTFTDPGLFSAVPNGLVIAGGSGLATTVGQVTITVGGVSDDNWVMPIGGA